jgi:hypothetical protein
MTVLLLSCADSKEKNTQDNKPDKVIILRNSSVSDQDLVKTKYEHAKLKCSLWVKKGEKLDKLVDKPVVAEWDFKNNFSTKKELKISKSSSDYEAEYTISVYNLYISDVEYTLDNRTYKRTMSPVIEFENEYTSKRYFSWGISHSDGHGSSKFAYENLVTGIVGLSGFSEDDPSTIFSNFMDCKIDAKIK